MAVDTVTVESETVALLLKPLLPLDETVVLARSFTTRNLSCEFKQLYKSTLYNKSNKLKSLTGMNPQREIILSTVCTIGAPRKSLTQQVFINQAKWVQRLIDRQCAAQVNPSIINLLSLKML